MSSIGRVDEFAVATAGILLVLNVTVVVFVYWRRLRLAAHERRAERVRARLAPIIESVRADASPADRQRLRDAVAELDRHSRPIAAALLIVRLEAPASERGAIVELLREVGAIDVLSTRRGRSWRGGAPQLS